MKPAMVVILLSAAACVTPYQSMGYSGGYSDEPLGDDTYIVTVKTNGYTDASTAYRYFHRRASELCRSNGFRSYDVLDSDRSAKRSVQASGNQLILIEKARVFGRVQCTGKQIAGPKPDTAPATLDSLDRRWRPAGADGDGNRISIDTITRRIVEDTVFVWSRTDYVDRNARIASVLSHLAFNCQARQSSVRATTSYNREGKAVYTGDYEPDYRMKPVVPGSVGEQLLSESCAGPPRVVPPPPSKRR